MRKILLLPTLILPYITAFVICCLVFWSVSFEAAIGWCLVMIGDMLASLITAFIYMVVSLKKGSGSGKAASVVKLFILPAELFNMVIGGSLMITLLTLPAGLLIIAIDLFSVFLTGIIMLTSAAAMYDRLEKKAVVYGILGFVPIADIVCAVKLARAERLKIGEHR